MALLHWRKFAFFDEENIVNTDLNQLVSSERPDEIPDDGQSFVPVQITCSSSGRVQVLFGDNKGFVYIVDRNLRVVDSFKANQRITSHIKQAEKVAVFVTCGSDQVGINPVLKLWNLEKLDRLNQPTCIKIVYANSGFSQPTPVTCVEIDVGLTLLLVGFEDGTIIIYQCDVKKPRRTRVIRQFKMSERPVTGIYLRNDDTDNQKPQLSGIQGLLTQNWTSSTEQTAFVSTENEIFFLNFSEKSFSKVCLENLGCKPKCSCLINGPKGSMKDSLFAVARDNAVYFYQIDGRGPCLAFEGEKLVLFRLRGYLVIISRNRQAPIDTSNRNRRPQSTLNLPATQRVNLNIYDINNKFIAHSCIVPEVQDIFTEWGHLFVVCQNGQLIMIREKDTQTKLDILFKKNQFSLVIEIAKSHQYNQDALTDIFKLYADYLYEKGDYDGSIMQYIKTIGRSEPSYVIKKFMDSQRINNLTVYLEALHKRSLATQEHTKLLLNCYSKLKNDQQLKQFIESYEEGNIKFDVEIAIKVLRNAGFYGFAIDLAKKHKNHELFFTIQMQDINDSLAALDFMNTIQDPHKMSIYMKKYGKIMLNDSPDKTIEMIKTICVRSRDSNAALSGSTNLYENVLKKSTSIYPEEFFHIFIGKNDLFVQLLEQLVSDGSEFATKAVHTLLLELYLNSWTLEKDELMKVPICDKIKKLLSLPNEKFDLEQSLILCKNNSFHDGLLHLYSRVGLYYLILDYYMEKDDSLKVLKTCEQFGCKDSELYLPTLKYFSAKDEGKLVQILKVIEHENIVPPLSVMSVLLENEHLSLGPIKEYLVRVLGKLRDKIFDNDNDIYHYKDDTELIRQKIEEFENHQTVFKPSICSACKGDLDLPSVHFLCSHSYHQNCFYNYSAESDECPICVVNNRKLLDEIDSHETRKSNLSQISQQFSTSKEDPFIMLAKLFGYGLF